MALARNDALAPYGGGPRRSRARGCVTVREPAKGFFITGSSIDPLNGIYFGVRPNTLGLPRCPQIAYRNDQTGWVMVLQPSPSGKARPAARRGMSPSSEESDGSDMDDFAEREWCLIDTCGYERFAHKGDTIIPGAGHRWWHLHRTRTRSGQSVEAPPRLAWHECREEDDYETAAEEEGELERRPKPPQRPRPEWSSSGALAEYLGDDEDELPWQVIAVLDFDVLRDLRGAFRFYKHQIEKAQSGTNLPRPGAAGLEDSCEPGCWIFRVVAPGGVEVRTFPAARARKVGHCPQGQYVSVLEREGAWLRLAPRTAGVDFDLPVGAQSDGAREGCWVQVDASTGRARLVPVAEADGASLAPLPSGGPEAELFDRPFEPRLQGPEEGAEDQAEEGQQVQASKDLESQQAREAKAAEAALRSSPPLEPDIGAEVAIEGLADARWNGQVGTVASRAGASGRRVVRLAQSGAQLSVRPVNLRRVLPGETGERGHAARVLGVALADLGIAPAAAPGAGASGEAPPRRRPGAAARLAAALRAAQRDTLGAPVAAVDAQQAHDLLAAALEPRTEGSPEAAPDDEALPPHTAVAAGELGSRASAAARAAGGAASIAAAEDGVAALRQVLGDEQRRLASAAGLRWPLRAAELHRAPAEGADALRLRAALIHGLLRCRRDDQALTEALAVVRAHPGAAAAHLWAGRVLLRQAKRDQGVAALERAVAAGPGSETADAAWGFRGAEARLRALRSADVWRRRAQDAYAYGDFETAAVRYGEALRASPDDDRWGRADCLASRAACHRRARQLGRAIEDCDAALALFPRYGRALFRRAACLLEAGRPSEAVQAFEVLLRVDRNWPGLCEWLVRAHALAQRAERSGHHGGGGGGRGRGAGRAAQEEANADIDGLHANSTDYYAVLGVTADATDKQLKRAYRLMSLKYHPDKQGGSTRLFQAISTAYETLADPEKRRAYDEGADVKRRDPESDSESEREEKSLREEIERKYFPERYKFWPFGDPFIEKRKLQARRRQREGKPAWPS